MRRTVSMHPHFLRAAVSVLTLSLVLPTVAAGAQVTSFAGLRELTEGVPPLFGPGSEALYSKSEARRNPSGRVLWANLPLLREMGVAVPVEGLTPAFEEALLAAFNYRISPQPDSVGAASAAEPATAAAAATKTLYADRYGGFGTDHYGSGRAASVGRVQLKGMGQTDLIAEKEFADPTHRDGSVKFEETIREVIWGEILHHELPYDANRALIVIDPAPGHGGTSDVATPYDPNAKDAPKVIMARVDPMRPAHFMRNEAANSILEGQLPPRTPALATERAEALKSDQARLQALLPKLPDLLPKSADFDATHATPEAKLRNGMFELIDRVAAQYATAYAKRLYHGATSPSNIGLRGEFLDFGTMTVSRGYGRQKLLDFLEPFGDTGDFKTYITRALLKDLQLSLPEALRKALPTLEEADARFDRTYEATRGRELIQLTGAPPELLQGLAAKKKGRLLISELAASLKSLAEQGNEKGAAPDENYFLLREWKRQGAFDLYAINRKLAKFAGTSAEALEAALTSDIADAGLRRKVSRDYWAFRVGLIGVAKAEGIQPEAVLRYLALANRTRDKMTPDLMWRNQIDDNASAMRDYQKNQDPAVISRRIESAVTHGLRSRRDAGPFEVVLSERPLLADGSMVVRQVFNARENAYRTLVRVAARLPDAAYDVANPGLFACISSGMMERSTLDYTIEGATPAAVPEKGQAPAVRAGEYLEFRLPMVNPQRLHLSLASGLRQPIVTKKPHLPPQVTTHCSAENRHLPTVPGL